MAKSKTPFEDEQFRLYEANRYLSHLSNEELFERISSILGAWTTLNTEGKISFGDPKEDRTNLKLIINLVHTQAELALRGNPEISIMEFLSLPKPRTSEVQRLKKIEAIVRKHRDCLFKFGEKRFLGKLSFKISLASTFDDESLQVAQRDSELSRRYRPHPMLGVSPFNRGTYENPIMERYRIDANFDYYVFCLTKKFSLRMFGDFNADSVLVIKDINAFSHSIKRAIESKVALTRTLSAPVVYYDDVRDIPPNYAPPELTKHFKYYYQREYRMAFLPKVESNRLEPHLIFETPELKDCTELIIWDDL